MGKATRFTKGALDFNSMTTGIASAPGASGANGPSQTVFDALSVSIKGGGGVGEYFVRLVDDVGTIAEWGVSVPNGQWTNFSPNLASGIRTGRGATAITVTKDSGTDCAKIRAQVEYHYE